MQQQIKYLTIPQSQKTLQVQVATVVQPRETIRNASRAQILQQKQETITINDKVKHVRMTSALSLKQQSIFKKQSQKFNYYDYIRPQTVNGHLNYINNCALQKQKANMQLTKNLTIKQYEQIEFVEIPKPRIKSPVRTEYFRQIYYDD
ncbi:Hypothetical_protein [Hexamita inflata]|uniref:Hypothetical_protein n=1 Tax=Hexamita inflata TaxID=28002 RepID=A0ABP1J9Y1_9EUKA